MGQAAAKPKPKAKMGRRTKLTPKLSAELLDYIRDGNTDHDSARLVGLSPASLCGWTKRGREEGEGIFFDFLKDYEKAKAEAVAASVAIIRRAAVDKWQAAAWWLERRYPKEWAPTQKTADVTVQLAASGDWQAAKKRALGFDEPSHNPKD